MLAALAILAAGTVYGATWINTTSGLLEVAENWDTDDGYGDPYVPWGEAAVFGWSGQDILVTSDTGFMSGGMNIGGSGLTTFFIATNMEYAINGRIMIEGANDVTFANGIFTVDAKFGHMYIGDRTGGHTVKVTGPHTRLDFLGEGAGILFGNHDTSEDGVLEVSGGAVVTSAQGSLAAAGGRNTTVITGDGSRFAFAGNIEMVAGDSNTVYVGDGGALSVNSTSLAGDGYRFTVENAVFTNFGGVVLGGSAGEFIVDGADFRNWGSLNLHGYGNRMEIRNDSTAYMYNGAMGNWGQGNVLRIQGSELSFGVNEWAGFGVGSGSASNCLEIVDGGKMSHYHNLTIGTIGGGAGCAGNVLRVENGTLELMRHTYFYQRGLVVASGGRVEIAGTNSLIDIAKHFVLLEHSVLRFEFGKEAPANPLIKVRSGFAGWNGGYGYGFEGDGSGRLEIDARKLACGGGGRVVLMELPANGVYNWNWEDASIVQVALLDFANTVTWDGGVAGALTVEPVTVYDIWYWPDGQNIALGNGVGWQLVATVPDMAGTMILLR